METSNLGRKEGTQSKALRRQHLAHRAERRQAVKGLAGFTCPKCGDKVYGLILEDEDSEDNKTVFRCARCGLSDEIYDSDVFGLATEMVDRFCRLTDRFNEAINRQVVTEIPEIPAQ